MPLDSPPQARGDLIRDVGRVVSSVSMTYEKSERWVHSQSASREEEDHADLNNITLSASSSGSQEGRSLVAPS